LKERYSRTAFFSFCLLTTSIFPAIYHYHQLYPRRCSRSLAYGNITTTYE
jgi:hypothetical protein